MIGETNLHTLLRTMKPHWNPGTYVFCTVQELSSVPLNLALFFFKEEEGITVVITQENADKLGLSYSYVAAWITLTVHSSLEAVGLTAAFSTALAQEGISCNVVAAYYHDHIFVDVINAEKALAVLYQCSRQP